MQNSPETFFGTVLCLTLINLNYSKKESIVNAFFQNQLQEV